MYAPVDAKDHFGLAWFVAREFSSWAARRGVEFDDLVQTAAVAIVRASTRYDPAKGFAFSTYAMSCARFTLIRAIQSHRRMTSLPGRDCPEPFDHAGPVEPNRAEAAEDAAELRRLLSVLPDRERLAVEKRFGLDGGETMTYQELGRLLGVSDSRAAQIISTAIERMRDARSGLNGAKKTRHPRKA